MRKSNYLATCSATGAAPLPGASELFRAALPFARVTSEAQRVRPPRGIGTEIARRPGPAPQVASDVHCLRHDTQKRGISCAARSAVANNPAGNGFDQRRFGRRTGHYSTRETINFPDRDLCRRERGGISLRSPSTAALTPGGRLSSSRTDPAMNRRARSSDPALASTRPSPARAASRDPPCTPAPSRPS